MIAIELVDRSQGRDFFSSMHLTYTQDTGQVKIESVNQGQEQGLQPVTPALTLDFSRIASNFPDVVAWISLDNTAINYPVVQGDDNAFYLTHLPNGQEHKMGSIFMDYRNSPDFSDDNTLIYGHNMASGDMFAALNNYRNQAFYEKHPTIKIKTPHNNYTLTLFAAYMIDSAVETVPINFDDSLTFRDYVAQAMYRSDFNADVNVNDGSRLVTLVTCINTGAPSYRYIVTGWLDTVD